MDEAPSLAGRLRRLPPVAVDGLLAALVFVLGVSEVFTDSPLASGYGDLFRRPDATAVVLLAVACASLVLRRRRPMLTLAASGTAIIVWSALGFADAFGIALPILLATYSVAAYAPRKEAIVGAITVVIGMAISLAAVSVNLPPGSLTLPLIVSNYVVFGTVWILGDNIRTRRAYMRQLEARAEYLERSQHEEAERAVAAERARIARELHDVVAHNVSVMVVQAGAGRRVATSRPERIGEVLTSIEQVGRQALTDMRRLLGVLRQEDEATDVLAPQPSMAHVDALVDQVRDAGLTVDLTIEGTPRALPSGVDLTAYRIVQEALTNALKHAGPARAEVAVRYRDDELEVLITDDGRGAASELAAGHAGHAGHGIVGMRERVSLFNGDLRVGPRPGGGYEVRAVLPLERQPA